MAPVGTELQYVYIRSRVQVDRDSWWSLFPQDNDEDIDEDDRYDDNDPRKPAAPGPGFDPTQFKGDPIAIMKLAKKGKVVMLFVTVAGSPTKKETEQITGRWQTSLFNAQFQVERWHILVLIVNV